MRALILLSVGLAGAQIVCAADGKPYAEHLDAMPMGTVEIHNVAGSVTVNGWAKPEVDIQGELGSMVERVEVSHTDDHVVITVILPQGMTHAPDHSMEATLQVRVPLDSTLQVSTVSAAIKVDGIRKASRLHTVSGDIHAEQAGAEEEIASVNGTVSISGNPTVATLRTSTVNGAVILTHGTGAITAHTVNGRLDLQVDGAKSADVRTVNGEVAFRGHLLPDATMKASSVNGKLSVQASADAGYMYRIASFGGPIHTCFGEQNAQGHLEGQVGANGAGHATVNLSTMHGEIGLCDR